VYGFVTQRIQMIVQNGNIAKAYNPFRVLFESRKSLPKEVLLPRLKGGSL
jgi:hypothetical protein